MWQTEFVTFCRILCTFHIILVAIVPWLLQKYLYGMCWHHLYRKLLRNLKQCFKQSVLLCFLVVTFTCLSLKLSCLMTTFPFWIFLLFRHAIVFVAGDAVNCRRNPNIPSPWFRQVYALMLLSCFVHANVSSIEWQAVFALSLAISVLSLIHISEPTRPY